MKRSLIVLSALSLLLLTATACSNTSNETLNQNISLGSVSGTPRIFYEQKTIAGFEPGGTPFGPSVLYRKDGVKGQPQKVFSLDSGSAFPSVTSNFSVEDGHLVRTSRNSTGAWTATRTKTTYNFSGIQLSQSTENEQAGFLQATLTSKESSTTATATMFCTEQGDAGPCPISFHLVITKKDGGTEKTLTEKDFSTPNLSGIRATPIAFSPNLAQLFVFLSGIGESWDPAALYSINLSTFAITQLMHSSAPDLTNNASEINRINVLRSSNDGNALYVERDFGPQAATGELLKVVLSTQEIKKIADIAPSVESHELKPDDTGTILQSPNGGFSYLDFSTGKTQRLTEQGNFLGWSRDGQYYLYRIFDDIHNGLGPYRLVVGSMETETQIEIVRQTVTAQSTKTTTKVGYILYAPVGIW